MDLIQSKNGFVLFVNGLKRQSKKGFHKENVYKGATFIISRCFTRLLDVFTELEQSFWMRRKRRRVKGREENEERGRQRKRVKPFCSAAFSMASIAIEMAKKGSSLTVNTMTKIGETFPIQHNNTGILQFFPMEAFQKQKKCSADCVLLKSMVQQNFGLFIFRFSKQLGRKKERNR